MAVLRVLVASLLLCGLLTGQPTQKAVPAKAKPDAPAAVPTLASRNGDRLAVQRVVLYKNGIGYFEHRGRVRGTQDVHIDFTSAQLDDVLKSLTVVDLGGGRVSALRYNSTAPLEQQMRTLRLPLRGETTLFGLLEALRGTRIEVSQGGASATGRLLTVERNERIVKDMHENVVNVSVVTDGGGIRNFEITPATSVRVVERGIAEDLDRYMGILGTTRSRDLRTMTISTAGEGERDFFVSYISEVPVWKSTYRILLPSKADKKPVLQGWAIIDNTVGEDWNNVELSLVAGAPQSFVQAISQPYYTRRPVMPLPQAAMLTPQTHEGTMTVDGVSADQAPPPPPASPSSMGYGGGIGGGTFKVGGGPPPAGMAALRGTVVDPSGAVVAGATVTVYPEGGNPGSTLTDSSGMWYLPVQPGRVRVVIESPGFNRLVRSGVYARLGQTTDVSVGLSVSAAATETVMVTAAEAEPEAQGGELGDLFEYKLKQRVSISKNQSALVPIVLADVEADKVTIVKENEDVPRMAVWLKNTSGLTLDSGTFNIVEQGAFAGEGLLTLIKPGERRLLSYAADTAVRVDSEDEGADKPVSRIRIVRGVLYQSRGREEKRTYTIRNEADEARNVVVEHPARDGWQSADDSKPEETSNSFHRFRVVVQPKSSAKLVVNERKQEEESIALVNTTNDHLALLLKNVRLKPESRQALEQIAKQKGEIASIQNTLDEKRRELNEIVADQQRLRENMKALKGSAEEKALLQRYTKQLNDQEDRLAALRTEMAKTQQQLEAARAALNKAIEALAVDETIGD